ncbi:MAG TPA: hypothetical protein VJ201_04805, partial [Candidatus Babeliales bacterium]|nr:hypothetical protein [Candidatus Babeliales bacterium]
MSILQCSQPRVELFLKSFLDNYDFSVEGRYSREYHQFLLSQTGDSFHTLEQQLAIENIKAVGRFIVLGYEEGAAPSYDTDFKASKIDDEAKARTNSGFIVRPHNFSGILTGYLLSGLLNTSSIVHCDENKIKLYSLGGVFCDHAFGQASQLMELFKKKITCLVAQGKIAETLAMLVTFWDYLYTNDVTLRDGVCATTQDILFSIAYAKYLALSHVPLFKFYVGPDITYPIETFVSQGVVATQHAQSFTPKILKNFKAVDEESTAYILCSFVDGVGKSTFLGNVKNYLSYGENVASYERVDNSSSQVADIFKIAENVYIADLPAQISHFTYKPEGKVYVDVETELSPSLIKDISLYVQSHFEDLKSLYKKLTVEVRQTMELIGAFDSSLCDSADPGRAFIKNCLLLCKIEQNNWIPFSYKGQHYLVQLEGDYQIRILRDLAGASSSGLKNIEAEQMLFFEGVRFPLPYNYFLNDLILKFKQCGIKRVVFVDFLSQYSRSQRENIRLNYIMQQIALIKGQFDPSKSLNKYYVHPAQLCADLGRKKYREPIYKNLYDESFLRASLYEVLKERTSTTVDPVPIALITDDCKKLHTKFCAGSVGDWLKNEVATKCVEESERLYKKFGMS